MSNIKPNEWYDFFAEYSRLDNPIDQTKKEAILLKENDEYLENFYMKIWEYQKSISRIESIFLKLILKKFFEMTSVISR